MTTPAQRIECATIMDYLVQHAGKVHYAQRRPMSTRQLHSFVELKQACAKPAGITMDCSESATLICRLAQMDDPNGLHYNGLGFTGTMLAHLAHYTNAINAETGALVVFGEAPGEHVCMVREPGRDPLLFSHGGESGPFYIRLSEERRYHSAPFTFLSVAKL